MTRRKIAYSEIALSKRKAIKKNIKENYGKERADEFSRHISKHIAELKKFPKLGVPLREKYGFDCDYYMLFTEHNYFIYRILDDLILIFEIFNEKEDFIYQLFGVVTTSQDTLDYWGSKLIQMIGAPEVYLYGTSGVFCKSVFIIAMRGYYNGTVCISDKYGRRGKDAGRTYIIGN